MFIRYPAESALAAGPISDKSLCNRIREHTEAGKTIARQENMRYNKKRHIAGCITGKASSIPQRCGPSFCFASGPAWQKASIFAPGVFCRSG